jgi:hypothetical protein
MKRRSIEHLIAGLIALTFVLGAFGTAAGASSEGSAAGRASDSEPNDDWNSAVPMASGETVEGTLRVTSYNWDTSDWYKLTVPYGKVLTANLYMLDYNTSDIGQYNFQLYLYSNSQTRIDRSWTLRRWENVMTIQSWSTNPATVGIRVLANYTWGGGGPHYYTDPGRYCLTATINDTLDYTASTTGFLDEKGPVAGVVYKLAQGPADDRLMRARLRCPVTGAFAVAAYDIWSFTGSMYLLNASRSFSTGYTHDIYFGGYNGTYYISVLALVGNGTYNLTTSDGGLSPDNNNRPEKAVLVKDNKPHEEFADQGVDWIDWWKVNAKAGVPINQVYVLVDGGRYQDGSTFYFAIYDQNIAQMGDTVDVPYTSGQPPVDHYSRTVNNITVGYDGPVYFSMRAISNGGNERYMDDPYVMCRAWYSLTFSLPNDKPVVNGTPPEVHILEDGMDQSTLLSSYCSDPNSDSLSYAYVNGSVNAGAKVNATTGRVSFTPRANWSGTERVRFKVTDDGPGNLYVYINVTVIVEPVNDPPVLTGSLPNLTILEENSIQTSDVSLLVSDIDDSKDNITYALRIVSADTHPPGASLDVTYDATNHTFKLGPTIGFFGAFVLELSMTDNHPGTTPLTLKFNLTVNHRNHDPVLKSGVLNPIVMELKEDETNSQLVISDFFTDPDMAADYAADMLKFNISGAKRLEVSLGADGRITVNTGKEEYYPGPVYEETLVLTAKDSAGRAVSLNLSVRVLPLNDLPAINTILPDKEEVTMDEGKKEVFRITAMDNDTADLVYSWFLDDVKQKETGSVLSFIPDYTMAGPHALKITVSDGTTTVEAEWKIIVNDVNRLPAVTIVSPINSTKFVKGTTVTFSATGSDPDGETLSFTWRDETGAVLGTVENLTINSLQPGTRIITVEANDGKGSSYQQVTVVITRPATSTPSGGFIPGFGLSAAVAAICLCAAALCFRRRPQSPRQGGPG